MSRKVAMALVFSETGLRNHLPPLPGLYSCLGKENKIGSSCRAGNAKALSYKWCGRTRLLWERSSVFPQLFSLKVAVLVVFPILEGLKRTAQLWDHFPHPLGINLMHIYWVFFMCKALKWVLSGLGGRQKTRRWRVCIYFPSQCVL